MANGAGAGAGAGLRAGPSVDRGGAESGPPAASRSAIQAGFVAATPRPAGRDGSAFVPLSGGSSTDRAGADGGPTAAPAASRWTIQAGFVAATPRPTALSGGAGGATITPSGCSSHRRFGIAQIANPKLYRADFLRATCSPSAWRRPSASSGAPRQWPPRRSTSRSCLFAHGCPYFVVVAELRPMRSQP